MDTRTPANSAAVNGRPGYHPYHQDFVLIYGTCGFFGIPAFLEGISHSFPELEISPTDYILIAVVSFIFLLIMNTIMCNEMYAELLRTKQLSLESLFITLILSYFMKMGIEVFATLLIILFVWSIADEALRYLKYPELERTISVCVVILLCTIRLMIFMFDLYWLYYVFAGLIFEYVFVFTDYLIFFAKMMGRARIQFERQANQISQ
ncbi:hypothetical protein NPIL_240731 [Nephila pilipes]|uniref:Uncharacterized protein n=1 Tax=Nephila pilipes TaxID=299642 RepID=A0A8X6UIM2_NEPPI|nr:hypothetical protein NPIL_240731 [Nephila pilipes]